MILISGLQTRVLLLRDKPREILTESQTRDTVSNSGSNEPSKIFRSPESEILVSVMIQCREIPVV
jgi:hypothetical protein